MDMKARENVIKTTNTPRAGLLNRQVREPTRRSKASTKYSKRVVKALAAAEGSSTATEKKATVKPAERSTDSKKGPLQVCQIVEGKFADHRWSNGRWELSKFSNGKGSTDWDKVIDAEMERRKILEETPVDSIYKDPVNFDTAEIPWWAWVRRFHLPEAEKLNGRAAMVGYAIAWIVDALSGTGLVDQQHSFLGKLLLHVAVFGILIFRSADVVPKFKNLFEEATFYDKQWKATWEGQTRPSETES